MIAITLGALILIPPDISIYNTGNRIRRAEAESGIDRSEAINPVLLFLLLFPAGF